MKLTKNEKKTLKLLIENAKITDSSIASKLNISSQAVGKIRKKLEENLIDSYTINLNYYKLGIRVFAISLVKLTPDGLDKGELEVEEKLINESNILQVYRLPNQNITHIILYGFKDMSELDNFFHSHKKKMEIHSLIENKELYTFSHNSLIKNNPNQLFNEIVDTIGVEPIKGKFDELESFKRKLK